MDLIIPLICGVCVGLGLKLKILRNDKQASIVKLVALIAGAAFFFLGPSLAVKKWAIIFCVSLIVGTFFRKE
ncbi:MAG TPA: hypothetical protein VEC37_02500 [Bacillota bacterium]|nr:hypothetical protein [Bacillota bacterium]